MNSANLIARRDLLRGTVALVGGSALGLLPSFAEASFGSPTPLALGFWSGGRFVDAARLSTGDADLDRVRLTVAGTGGVQAIEAHAPSAGTRYPFTLWVPPPGGMVRSVANLATEPNGDLVLGTFVKGDRREIRLVAGRAVGPKLRAGRYVLTTSPLSSFGQDERGEVVSRDGAPFVALSIERA